MRISQPSQAVILVGGLGSRLGQLTQNTPKPLLMVGGQPFLDYLVEEVARHGCRRLLLLAEFEAEQVRAYVEASPIVARFGLAVDIAVEPSKAGTGGALWWARDRLDPSFFLLNGDSWVRVNLLDLAPRLDSAPWSGVMALRRVEDGSRYGTVDLSGGRVRAFQQGGQAGAALVNAGVYLLRREIVDCLGPRSSIEADLFPRLVAEDLLIGHEVDGSFIDIGVPEALAEAREIVAVEFRRPALFLDRDGVLNVDYGYVASIDQFTWNPGAIEAIKLANDRGYLVFVVSNQAGVARGFYTEDNVKLLHAHIQAELALHGAHIDDFRYCPYHIDGIVPRYARHSDWRKPAPGMLMDLARVWRVDMERSIMIGDQPTDMACAEAAGITGHLYGCGRLDDVVREYLRAA